MHRPAFAPSCSNSICAGQSSRTGREARRTFRHVDLAHGSWPEVIPADDHEPVKSRNSASGVLLTSEVANLRSRRSALSRLQEMRGYGGAAITRALADEPVPPRCLDCSLIQRPSIVKVERPKSDWEDRDD